MPKFLFSIHFGLPWIKKCWVLLLGLCFGSLSWEGFSQVSTHGRMAPSETVHLELDLPQAGHWVLDLDQRGIDLTLTAIYGDPSQTISVDSPQDEWGSERLLLLVEKPQVIRVILRTRETRGSDGRYQLQGHFLGSLQSSKSPLLPAEQVTTQAGMAYFENSPKVWQKALDAYQKEAELRAKQNQDKWEARALYCTAVLYRLLENREEAQAFADRTLHLQRQLGMEMGMGFTANELGLLALRSGDYASARRWFEDAVEIRRQLEQPGLQGASQNNVCLTLLNEGQFDQAVPCLQEALRLSENGRRISTQLSVHTNLGLLFDRQAIPSKARKHYEAALKLQPASPGWGRARLHNNMGAFHVRLSNFQEGLQHYFEALTLFRKLGEKSWEARVLNNLGNAYLQLDLPDRALPFLNLALPLRRSHGNQRGELTTLINLGLAYEAKGDFPRGLDYFEQAITVAEAANHHRDRGRANLGAARVLEKLGRFAAALSHIELALQEVGFAKFPVDLAQAHLIKGKILQATKAFEQALEECSLAKTLFHQQESLDGLIHTNYLMARVNQTFGKSNAAIKAAQLAVDQIEKVRNHIHLESLRRSFFARHHQVYTLMVSLKMALAGTDEKLLWDALIWSERGKAREYHQLQHHALNSFGEPSLRPASMSATDLRMEVHAKVRFLEKLRLAQNSPEVLDKASLRLEEALHQLDRHELAYGTSPTWVPSKTESLSKLATIQKQLGEKTHMLVYHLDEKQSYGWHVSPSGIKAFELPGREDIEKLVTKVYRETSRLRTTKLRSKNLESLGNLLYKPLANLKQIGKLIIIPDGSLHLAPFGLLPRDPSGKGVLHEFEITRLPSVTTFPQQKRRSETKNPVKKMLIMADPVFQLGDKRLPPIPLGQSSKLMTHQMPAFSRISATQQEAEIIAQLAKNTLEIKTLLGLDANLEQVFTADLKNYSYLHFATHTQLDFTYPELSAMVLSLFNEKHADRPGHLYLHQLKHLSLNAELVVLSGCETAMGKIIRGEGLPGLARGFMQAGSKNVVASLWPVPDQATAAFMARFYEALMKDKVHPAVALRQAQMSLQENGRYRHPFYWGGWILFGLGE